MKLNEDDIFELPQKRYVTTDISIHNHGEFHGPTFSTGKC
jgi:hypothetical protein